MAQETGFHIVSLPTILENLVSEIKARNDVPELPTGLKILDEKIWGLHRGELTVIGARPSEGKSALSMQLAHYIATFADKRVIFVSLEMSKEQLMERIMCCVNNWDSWNLRKGTLPADFDEKVAWFKTTVEKIPLRIFDLYGYEYKQIEQIIESLPHVPDVLFLDYIQLISPNGKEMRDAMVEYLRLMKALALRNNMAIVICSQLNRSSMDSKEPQLHHLKQTGALEEVADTVLLCWWKNMAEDANDVECDYTIRIAKQRHGPISDVTVKFLPNRFRFSDPPRDRSF